MVLATVITCTAAKTRDRREQEEIVLEEREVPRERDLYEQQHDGRQPT